MSTQENSNNIDYQKLLNKMLDNFPTKEDTLNFFEKNHKFFTEGKYKASNFDRYKSKFSARAEDSTPSTLCKPRLTTVDFGDTGKQKGILYYIADILNEQEEDKSKHLSLPKHFPVLVKKLAEMLNVDENQNIDDYIYVPVEVEETKKSPPYSTSYIQKQKEYSLKDAKTKKLFKELMEGLCRSCSIDEMRRAVKIFNIGLTHYMDTNKETKKIRKVHRLFIPEYSTDLTAFGSFRYNRGEDPKGLLRKKCVRVLFGNHISHVFKTDKPIIFAEGHSDVIVNNSKRIQTITSGSATTPIGDNIEEMKGKTYHLFYDLDLPGVKGITERVVEIEEFNKDKDEEDKIKYKIFQWSSKIIIDDEVKDFIDYEEDQKEVIKRLKGDTRRGITLSDDEIFEKARISNWRVLSHEPKKKGYDWIDFHTDMQTHDRYKVFIDTYTY